MHPSRRPLLRRSPRQQLSAFSRRRRLADIPQKQGEDINRGSGEKNEMARELAASEGAPAEDGGNEEATTERVSGGGGCQPTGESPLFVSPPGEISAKFTVETRPINFIP